MLAGDSLDDQEIYDIPTDHGLHRNLFSGCEGCLLPRVSKRSLNLTPPSRVKDKSEWISASNHRHLITFTLVKNFRECPQIVLGSKLLRNKSVLDGSHPDVSRNY